MAYLRTMLVATAVACAAGCGTLPAANALDSANVRKITWTRDFEGAAFRDQFGVCHTFSRDNEAALRALGSQVEACFEGSLPEVVVNAPALRSTRVLWTKAPAARVNDLYAEQAAQSVAALGARRKPAILFAVRGFYTFDSDTCHVIVSDHPDYARTLGHEFKHCVDGHFHDERGRWTRTTGDDRRG